MADRQRFEADPDPTYKFDAEPDLDPTLKVGYVIIDKF
jgi:hypothetical protein